MALSFVYFHSINNQIFIIMKTIKSFLVMVLAILFSGSSSAQSAQKDKTEKFKVLGNCTMCENRIEKTALAKGATSAVWDVKTKMLTVSFDPAKISRADLEKQVALAGHDTEKFKADDKVYNSLPACCKYDRTGKSNSSDHDHTGHSH